MILVVQKWDVCVTKLDGSRLEFAIDSDFLSDVLDRISKLNFGINVKTIHINRFQEKVGSFAQTISGLGQAARQYEQK